MKRITLPNSSSPDADRSAELSTELSADRATPNLEPPLPEASRETVSLEPALLPQEADLAVSPAIQVKRQPKSFFASLIWLWLLGLCGATGIGALIWLTSIPPLPDCQQSATLTLDTEKLFCATQTAQSGKESDLVTALNLVKGWNSDHPLHSRANELANEWATTLLDRARQKAIETDLKGAIALAQMIPSEIALQQEAKAAITAWEKDLNQGERLVHALQTAMKARNWAKAAQHLRALAQLDSDYWSQQVSRLRHQLTVEQLAAKQLLQAQRLAGSDPQNMQLLGRAIALVEQITPGTHAHAQATKDRERWLQTLYTLVAKQLSSNTELDKANTIMQRLPLGVPLPAVADILWFSRAQSLLQAKQPNGSLPQHLWHLWQAFSQLHQISSDSPLYTHTTALLPRLEQHIQDVTQLNAASALANLGQIPTLQGAIAIAKGIAPDRPRRVYAQTLAAKWQQDLQQIADRPYLNQAERLAASGKPADLKQAIAYARQISPQRPLYRDAQIAITTWTRQIQLVTDGPILARAQTLARQQRLGEAIQVAQGIRQGRALYKEAQAAIANWAYQLEVGRDRPLLNQAYALADRGNLTGAIDTAAQIGSGSALSGEAQGAIANWRSQLSPRRQNRPTPAAEPDGSQPENPTNVPADSTSPGNTHSVTPTPSPTPSSPLPPATSPSPPTSPANQPDSVVVPVVPEPAPVAAPTPAPTISPVSPADLPLP